METRQRASGSVVQILTLFVTIVFGVPSFFAAINGSFWAAVWFWVGVWFVLPLSVAIAVPRWCLSWSDVRGFVSDTRFPWLWIALGQIAVSTFVIGLPTLDRKAPSGYYDIPQRNWLGISARLQDVTLRLPQKWKPSHAIGILLLSESYLSWPTATRRVAVTDALKTLAAGDLSLTGVVLDGTMTEETIPEIDRELCEQVDSLRSDDIQVILGYDFEESNGFIRKLMPVSSVRNCFRDGQLGHVLGFAQIDKVVRFVPQYLHGPGGDDPSLSMRAATIIAGERGVSAPERLPSGLVWFGGRKEFSEMGIPKVQMHDNIDTLEDRLGTLSGRIVFVAFENTEGDSWNTPFGTLRGVEVHALATESLLTGTYVRATPNWVNLLGIVILCGFICVHVHRGTSIKSVFGWCILATVLLVVVSVCAMAFSRVWIDIVFVPSSFLLLALGGHVARSFGWAPPERLLDGQGPDLPATRADVT